MRRFGSRSLGVTLGWVLALSAFVTPRADACSCAPSGGHARDVENHSVAFLGHVVAIAREGTEEIVTFAVTRVWRGLEPEVKRVRVRRDAGRHLCPIPTFELGVTYRVYAMRGEDGLPRVGFCNPSRRVPQSDAGTARSRKS